MGVGNNGWHYFFYLLPQHHSSTAQVVRHSDLALAVMMSNFWAVLAPDDCLEGGVREWESYGTVLVSLAILHKVCMTMVGLASTSTCDILPDTTSGPLRLGFNCNAT